MNRNQLDIRSAGEDRLGAVARAFSRASIDDPMMRWSLVGARPSAPLLKRCFTYFFEVALVLGFVWEVGDTAGAAVWIPPGACDGLEEHPWNQTRILELCDDAERYEAFWNWVDSRIPDEPLWLLDSIAVDPSFQRQGYGRALIEAGVKQAEASGCGAVLSTGTMRNLEVYANCGFRIIDHDDAPDGGPHIWFMRWDPDQS
jgi:GNAT superfamily N-acetyltransferase